MNEKNVLRITKLSDKMRDRAVTAVLSGIDSALAEEATKAVRPLVRWVRMTDCYQLSDLIEREFGRSYNVLWNRSDSHNGETICLDVLEPGDDPPKILADIESVKVDLEDFLAVLCHCGLLAPGELHLQLWW